MNKQDADHPDLLSSTPIVTNRKHQRGRGSKPSRSPLRDIPYLSGNLEERKRELKRRAGVKRGASGDSHYMRRKKRARDNDRHRIRTTSRGIKHLYTYWRNVRSPTDVSFEEWFVIYTSGEASTLGKGEKACIRRYDSSKPWFLDNLYLARMKGSTELELLADASTLVGERGGVRVYTAPPGRMDARRMRYSMTPSQSVWN